MTTSIHFLAITKFKKAINYTLKLYATKIYFTNLISGFMKEESLFEMNV